MKAICKADGQQLGHLVPRVRVGQDDEGQPEYLCIPHYRLEFGEEAARGLEADW